MTILDKRIHVVAACLSAWAMGLPIGQAAPPQTQPDKKVVATVNGEPILESELLAALPEDAFDDTLAGAKKEKLERLVETAVQAQFVKDHKIDASDAKVKEAIKEFEDNLASASCPCCGGPQNLQSYMVARWYTISEFERKVRADVGMGIYVDRLLAETVTPKLISERRAEVEKGFVKGDVVFFPYRYDPDYGSKPDAAKARCEELGKQALARLRKGDAIEAVLQGVESKAFGYPTGTCIAVQTLNDEAKAAWPKLPVGKFCDPLKTSAGVYIIRPLTLTDDDVRDVLCKQLDDSIRERVAKELKAALDSAKIEYPGTAAAKP